MSQARPSIFTASFHDNNMTIQTFNIAKYIFQHSFKNWIPWKTKRRRMRNLLQRSTQNVVGKLRQFFHVALSGGNHSLRAFLVGTGGGSGLRGRPTGRTLRGPACAMLISKPFPNLVERRHGGNGRRMWVLWSDYAGFTFWLCDSEHIM